MNVLDENIVFGQREVLRRWRIPFRQIGYELSKQGIKDPQIIPLLLLSHVQPIGGLGAKRDGTARLRRRKTAAR